MSVAENKELIRRYFDWDVANFLKESDAYKSRWYTPDLVTHSTTGDMNLDQSVGYLKPLATAFPDIKLIIEDMVAEGNKVAVRYYTTGTQQSTFMGIPASGKKIKISGLNIYRIEGSKIAEIWMLSDGLGMMQQLGAIPSAPMKK